MLATLAYALGIINENFFATLVMVAIITSLMAGYWFKFVLNRQWELLPSLSEANEREVRLPVAGKGVQEHME